VLPAREKKERKWHFRSEKWSTCGISTCTARSVERRSRSFPSCPHPIVRFIVRIATRSDVPQDKGDRAEADAGTESAIDSLVSRSTLSACSFLFWVVAGIPVHRDARGKHLLCSDCGKAGEDDGAREGRGCKRQDTMPHSSLFGIAGIPGTQTLSVWLGIAFSHDLVSELWHLS